MKKPIQITSIVFAAALALFNCDTLSAKGGFIELEPVFDDDSNQLTNSWWPLPYPLTQVFLAEEDDECVISVLDVMPWIGPYAKVVTIDGAGVKARTVMDAEYIDTVGECDGALDEIDDWELLEITLDWYTQDVAGVMWYVGEHTIALDVEEGECEHPTDGVDAIFGVEGCLDGSWEVGYDLWEEQADEEILAGIIMLDMPEKGMFYFQEYWEDNATDMAKVLNFKSIETFLFGEQGNCAVIKEWVPLEPGNVEHKYYCDGYGLVLVEGNAGGKTVWTDLVFDSRFPELPEPE